MDIQRRHYVLDGGPGTGKSTLLAELQKNRIYTIREAAEHLIRRGVRPERGRNIFQARLLELQLRWERSVPNDVPITVQDRGVPSAIAYYRIDGTEPPEWLLDAARKCRYDKVFILEPLHVHRMTWTRKENRQTAIALHREISKAYKALGYEPVRIPNIPKKERAEMVLKILRTDDELS